MSQMISAVDTTGDICADDADDEGDSEIEYYRCPLADTPEQMVIQLFDEVGEFMKAGRAKNEKVMVHCTSGVNIAPTIVASFLIKHQDMDLAEALTFLKKGCRRARPTSHCVKLLSRYEELQYKDKWDAKWQAEPEPWWTEFKNGGKGLTGSVSKLERPVWQVTKKETPEEIAARKEKQAQEAAEFPLHCAAVMGEIKMVKHLLEVLGEDIHGHNHKDATPLFLACQGGHLAIVKLMVEGHNADVEKGIKPPNRMSPIFAAAQNGHLEVVKFLVNVGNAAFDTPTNKGVTPIFYAAKEGRTAVVDYLISKGADPNRRLPDGTTPVFIAAEYGQLSVVKYLCCEAQVDTNVPRTDGKTALKMASENGHVQVLQALVVHGRASWNSMSDQMAGQILAAPPRPHYS